MALHYLFLLFVLWIPSLQAREHKDAQDALTRAVMKVPMISESKKYWEKRARNSDFKFLFYLGPVMNKSATIRHHGIIYTYEWQTQKMMFQYRMDF